MSDPTTPDPTPFVTTRADPRNPKSTARARVRRMTTAMREAIPPSMSQQEALERLAQPAALATMARSAHLLLQTPSGVLRQRVQEADLADLAHLQPVRRIGTYKGARNRVSGHPHLPRAGGPPVQLLTESNLELTWLRYFEFLPSTRAMLTQPFALVWPLGDQCLYRVPDLAVLTTDGPLIVDVKPDAAEVRTQYVNAMLALTQATVALAGWRAHTAGSVPNVFSSNLRAISAERRTPHELAPTLEAIRSSRPRTIGAALTRAPNLNDGMRAVLHLLTGEVATDLTRPILLGSPLNWNSMDNNEVELAPTSTWTDGATTFTVVGIAVDDSELLLSVWAGGDDYRTYTVREVIKLMCEAKWATTPELSTHADDGELLTKLDDARYSQVLNLERALLEARTGYPTHIPGPDATPRPHFDPQQVGLKQRMKNAAKEQGLSVARFYEVWAKWEKADRARASLVHGNTKAPNQVLDGYSQETIEFARGFVARQSTKARKDRGKQRALLLEEMLDAGHERLTVYKLDRLLTELQRTTALFGDASTRHTKAEKPTTGGRRSRPNQYASVMEADSTPLDFLIWSPGGQEWLNVWGIFLTCVTTKITTVRLTTSPPDSRAFALALARMMMPPTVEDVAQPFRFAPVAPDEVLLGPDLWPAAIPGELHIDHGSEYENAHLWEICARLLITIRLARTRTPPDKPHIEAAIGKAARIVQLIDGHKGNAVKNRGKRPELEPLLTFQAAQAVMDAACLQTMYEPHSGLPHPMVPNRFLTPVQAYNNAIRDDRPVRAKANPNQVFELLVPVEGTVSGNEVTVNQIVYRAPDPTLMRQLSAGDRYVPSRKLLFRYDPHDLSRLFWHVPGTGQWQTLRAVHAGREVQPFSDVLFARMLHEMPRSRLNKQERLDIDVELRRFMSTLSRTKAGRKELAREFSRVYEAVPDPKPWAEDADPTVSAPNLTVIDGGNNSGPDDRLHTIPLTRTHRDFMVELGDTPQATASDEGDYELQTFEEDDFLDGGY